MLQPLHTIPQGIVLQPIFFQSKGFVEALREDVNTVLTRFHAAFMAQAATALITTEAQAIDRDHQALDSPFEIFKNVWTETGFNNVFLLVIEPSSRQAWWEVLTKCFAERIVPGAAPDLLQLAALYSLYTLVFSQPDTQEHQVLALKFTLATVRQILTLPASISSNPLDTHYIIKRLLVDAVIYIIPDALKDYPPLPTNRVLSKSADQQTESVGKLALSIKQEMESLAEGPNPALMAASNPMTVSAAHSENINVPNEMPFPGETWATEMRRVRANYLANRDAVRNAADASSIRAAEQKAAQRVIEARVQAGLAIGLASAGDKIAETPVNENLDILEGTGNLFGRVGLQGDTLVDATANFKRMISE